MNETNIYTYTYLVVVQNYSCYYVYNKQVEARTKIAPDAV